MRTLTVVLAVLSLAAAACGSSADTVLSSDVDRAPVAAAAPTAELVDGLNQAGLSFLRGRPEVDNTVFSPVSLGHALLMARAAADAETGDAIDAAFGFPTGIGAHEAWNAVDAAIVASNGTAEGFDGEPSPVVTLADRIWPATDATPDQEWVDVLAAYHGADVERIDVNEPDESAATINAWIAEATEGLITDLVPSSMIRPTTRLILTDAIYFEATWQTVFGKYGTVTRDFTRLDQSTVEVELMRELENRGERGVGDGWAAVELPYRGDDYSMLVIVPDVGRFGEVRDRLDTDLLAEVDATTESGPFELLLPKWSDTTTIDLLPWLESIGAAPGWYPAIGAELASGVHGADIAVDEYGTVAAAATALGFDESGAGEPELVIAVDRPFLYLIRHLDTGLVLFAGQVTDPTA